MGLLPPSSLRDAAEVIITGVATGLAVDGVEKVAGAGLKKIRRKKATTKRQARPASAK